MISVSESGSVTVPARRIRDLLVKALAWAPPGVGKEVARKAVRLKVRSGAPLGLNRATAKFTGLSEVLTSRDRPVRRNLLSFVTMIPLAESSCFVPKLNVSLPALAKV